MSNNHHSQSGPVKITGRFPPEPASPLERKARLLSKIAYYEGKVADQTTWNTDHPERANRANIKKYTTTLNHLRFDLRLDSSKKGATEEAHPENPASV